MGMAGNDGRGGFAKICQLNGGLSNDQLKALLFQEKYFAERR